MRRGLFAWQRADIAYDDITIPAACKDGQVDHVGPELQHRAGHIPQSAHMTLATLLCDGPECSDPTCANDEWPREYLPKFKWKAPVVRSSNCTQTHETAMPGHDAARTETVCVVLHALRGRGTGAHMRTVCSRLGTLATACMLRVYILRVCTCARGAGEWGGWGWSPSKSAKMSQYTQRTAPPQSHAFDISLADTIESPLPSQSWPTGKVRSILHSKPAGGPRAFQGLSSFPGMRTTQTRVRSDLANCCRIHRPEVAVGHRKATCT